MKRLNFLAERIIGEHQGASETLFLYRFLFSCQPKQQNCFFLSYLLFLFLSFAVTLLFLVCKRYKSNIFITWVKRIARSFNGFKTPYSCCSKKTT